MSKSTRILTYLTILCMHLIECVQFFQVFPINTILLSDDWVKNSYKKNYESRSARRIHLAREENRETTLYLLCCI